jgi:hypothetical protein
VMYAGFRRASAPLPAPGVTGGPAGQGGAPPRPRHP